MVEPCVPENACRGSWQLAQLVPAGSESRSSKKIWRPMASRGDSSLFGGACLIWATAADAWLSWARAKGGLLLAEATTVAGAPPSSAARLSPPAPQPDEPTAEAMDREAAATRSHRLQPPGRRRLPLLISAPPGSS